MAVFLFFLLLAPYMYFSIMVAVLGRFLLLFDPMGRHALTRREKIMACMPVIPLVIVVGAVFRAGYPMIAVILILLVVVLVLTIQFPLIRDRSLRRKANQAED